MRPSPRLLFACVATAAVIAAPPARAAGQLLRNLVASDYPADASYAELLRRLASPLTQLAQERELHAAGKTLAPRALEPAAETFLAYVPQRPPPPGYALVVFIPPWEDARLPTGWAPVLDRFGAVFVTAARSGNAAAPLLRRVPLALLAAAEVQRRYPVDPQRIWIAGFSGGARVALRVALAYPDLFRGAILDAGSDPIGTAQLPLPPRELFERFQSSSRIVYLTGERDAEHLLEDALSIRSLHQWCVANVDDEVQPRVQHEVALPGALAQALATLSKSPAPDSARLSACRTTLAGQLQEQLRDAQVRLDQGAAGEARQRLRGIDERFGGLAAPHSVELAQRLQR